MVFILDFSNAALDIRFYVRENGLKGFFGFNDRLRGVGQSIDGIGEPLRNLLANVRHGVDAVREIRKRRLDFLEPVSQTAANIRQNIAQAHRGLFEIALIAVCCHADVCIAHAIVVLRQLLAECNHRIRELLHRIFGQFFGSGDAVGKAFVDELTDGVEHLRRRMNAKSILKAFNETVCQFASFISN